MPKHPLAVHAEADRKQAKKKERKKRGKKKGEEKRKKGACLRGDGHITRGMTRVGPAFPAHTDARTPVEVVGRTKDYGAVVVKKEGKEKGHKRAKQSGKRG